MIQTEQRRKVLGFTVGVSLLAGILFGLSAWPRRSARAAWI